MIEFRPHHFMCTLGFQGRGYSPSFIRNYQKIAQQLKTDPDTEIKITKNLDSVCRACPHQTKDKLCQQQSKIEKLDNAHQEILNLELGEVITWALAKELIKQKMTPEKFHVACESCEWKSYGVCEAALLGSS